MTNFERNKILEQLNSLRNLPQIKEVKALKKRLQQELERLEEKRKLVKAIPEFTEIAKEQKKINANVKRSRFMKKKWNYIRQIYSNYPEIRKTHGLRAIFSMYSKRKKGEKIPISDVYWQNPSQ